MRDWWKGYGAGEPPTKREWEGHPDPGLLAPSKWWGRLDKERTRALPSLIFKTTTTITIILTHAFKITMKIYPSCCFQLKNPFFTFHVAHVSSMKFSFLHFCRLAPASELRVASVNKRFHPATAPNPHPQSTRL